MSSVAPFTVISEALLAGPDNLSNLFEVEVRFPEKISALAPKDFGFYKPRVVSFEHPWPEEVPINEYKFAGISLKKTLPVINFKREFKVKFRLDNRRILEELFKLWYSFSCGIYDTGGSDFSKKSSSLFIPGPRDPYASSVTPKTVNFLGEVSVRYFGVDTRNFSVEVDVESGKMYQQQSFFDKKSKNYFPHILVTYRNVKILSVDKDKSFSYDDSKPQTATIKFNYTGTTETFVTS